MMKKMEVIGLGALNTDHIYKVEHILGDGETMVEEVGCFPGGSAANTIYGLAMLGIDTAFIGVVGGDGGGRLVIDGFNRIGVDTNQIVIKQGSKTGTTMCLITPSGERSIYVVPGANSLLSDDGLDLSLINKANILHLSSFVGDRQFQLSLELVNKLAPSVRLSFAPGELYVTRGLGALAPMLARTDTLFLNRSELEELTGKDFKDGAEVCRQQGCRIVVVTMGSDYKRDESNSLPVVCYVVDADDEYLVESTSREGTIVVDTTGAGDAFTAGFLFGLLNDKGLEKCGRLGDINARFCISRFGARQGLPNPTQLEKRYSELYKESL